MQWSQLILEMHENGNSVAAIVDYLDHPIVTDAYVRQVLSYRKKARKKHWTEKLELKGEPPTNSRLFVLHQKVMEFGGKELFLKELKKLGGVYFSKKFDVPITDIWEYARRFVYGRRRLPKIYKDSEQQRRGVSTRIRQTKKSHDLKNLF